MLSTCPHGKNPLERPARYGFPGMFPEMLPDRFPDKLPERFPEMFPDRLPDMRVLGGAPSLDAGEANGEFEIHPELGWIRVMDELLEWWPPPIEGWRGEAVVEQLPSRRSPPSVISPAKVQLKLVLRFPPVGKRVRRLTPIPGCLRECCRLLEGCEKPCHTTSITYEYLQSTIRRNWPCMQNSTVRKY